MRVMSRIRQLAFVLVLVGSLAPQPAAAIPFDDCPDQGCGYCPAQWWGYCYIPGSTPCEEFDCVDVGTCGGGFTLCWCDICI